MKNPRSKKLVIDACVAQSCGDNGATYPTSKYCRNFLIAVLDICHHAVISPEINDEWNEHQSRFARKWRVQMTARKKLDKIYPQDDPKLTKKILECFKSEKQTSAVGKDLLLITAAFNCDRIIVSLDDTAKQLFWIAATNIHQLQEVAWVNPNDWENGLEEWLVNGAEKDERFLLRNADARVR